ncbi:MAG: hypothetical protein ACXAC5_21730 [Promethearchaeota archaeon]|jgi:hypothetical protein
MNRSEIAEKFRLFPSNKALSGEKISVCILSLLAALGIVTFPAKVSILLFILLLAGVVIIRCWNWFPLFLLLFIWYVPGQTVPGGLLENYMALKWSTYIIIPLLFAGYFISEFLKAKWDMTPIIIPLILIALCIVFSAFINGSNLLNTLSAFGLYLRYPLLFLVFVNMNLKEPVIKKIIQLFLLLTLIQIPEILFRRFSMGISGDLLSWSLGPWGTFPLGIYCIYSISIVTAMALNTGFKWYYILLLVAFMSPAGIGEIKALIICAPIVMLVVLLGIKRSDIFIRRGIPILFLLIVIVFWIFTHWENFAGSNALIEFFVNIKYLFLSDRRSIDLLSINRLGQIFLIWEIISDNFKNLLFGFGPGSSLAGNLLGTPGIVALLITGHSGHPSGQLVAVLGDLGLLGLLLHLALFSVILNFSFRCLKEVKDEKYKVIALAFLGMWVFYVLLGPLYNLVWRYDVSSFIFWFIATVIYRKTKESRKLAAASHPSGQGHEKLADQ